MRIIADCNAKIYTGTMPLNCVSVCIFRANVDCFFLPLSQKNMHTHTLKILWKMRWKYHRFSFLVFCTSANCFSCQMNYHFLYIYRWLSLKPTPSVHSFLSFVIFSFFFIQFIWMLFRMRMNRLVYTTE